MVTSRSKNVWLDRKELGSESSGKGVTLVLFRRSGVLEGQDHICILRIARKLLTVIHV